MEEMWKRFTAYALTHTTYQTQKKFAKEMPLIRRYVLDGGKVNAA